MYGEFGDSQRSGSQNGHASSHAPEIVGCPSEENPQQQQKQRGGTPKRTGGRKRSSTFSGLESEPDIKRGSPTRSPYETAPLRPQSKVGVLSTTTSAPLLDLEVGEGSMSPGTPSGCAFHNTVFMERLTAEGGISSDSPKTTEMEEDQNSPENSHASRVLPSSGKHRQKLQKPGAVWQQSLASFKEEERERKEAELEENLRIFTQVMGTRFNEVSLGLELLGGHVGLARTCVLVLLQNYHLLWKALTKDKKNDSRFQETVSILVRTC